MKNIKIKKHSLMALSLVLCLGITGIAAYFTDADTATNEFTVGKVSLDLQEPNWDPENGKDLVPGDVIVKDPKILNDGVNDEFVFMQVVVPYANVVTANNDGTKNAAADTELFSYEINSGWVEIGTPVKDETAKTVTHLYAYGTEDAMTALEAEDETPALFESVKFANVVEDQNLETSAQQIVINAYGIQTANINGGVTAPADVWTVVANQAPSTAVGEEHENTDIKK